MWLRGHHDPLIPVSNTKYHINESTEHWVVLSTLNRSEKSNENNNLQYSSRKTCGSHNKAVLEPRVSPAFAIPLADAIRKEVFN